MEDYVTYEQAKKLKELGFDWKCFYFYDNNKKFRGDSINSGEESITVGVDDFKDNWNFTPCNKLSAPTLSQAQKWLREKHNIHIQIEACMGHKWTYELVDTYCRQDITGEYISRIPERDSYPLIATYEQSLSAGIDAALELLK